MLIRTGEIKSLQELEQFLEEVGNFHDGLIKEVHWVNLSFVAENLGMEMRLPARLRMLVQMQWAKCPCTELILEDAVEFCIDTQGGAVLVLDSEASQHKDGRLQLIIGTSIFLFSSMRYQIRDDWLGTAIRFGELF